MFYFIPPSLLFYSLLASMIALVGGFIFLYVERLSDWLERYGVPFAAGTMIVTALMGLLPEADHILGFTSFAVFAASFMVTFFFEEILVRMHHHSDKHHKGHKKTAKSKKSIQSAVPLVLVGDTIHNFIDGIAIAAAFIVNPSVAFITAISTFLHEVPHEIGDFSILIKAGWKKRHVLLVNIFSASATLVGTILISLLPISEQFIGYLLAATAGIFFYLGTVDFLPHAFDSHHSKPTLKSRVLGLAPVVVGAIVMALSLSAVPHSHDEVHFDDDHHDEIHADEDQEMDHEYLEDEMHDDEHLE